MVILGIDPGLKCTGYGIIEERDRKIIFIAAGTISPRKPFPDNLLLIYEKLSSIISSFKPEVAAIEDIYVAKNARISLRIGMVEGVAIISALHQGLKVASFSPLEIKQAVVGRGRATKEQVQFMVKKTFNLTADLSPDSADAVATAISYLRNKDF